MRQPSRIFFVFKKYFSAKSNNNPAISIFILHRKNVFAQHSRHFLNNKNSKCCKAHQISQYEIKYRYLKNKKVLIKLFRFKKLPIFSLYFL